MSLGETPRILTKKRKISGPKIMHSISVVLLNRNSNGTSSSRVLNQSSIVFSKSDVCLLSTVLDVCRMGSTLVLQNRGVLLDLVAQLSEDSFVAHGSDLFQELVCVALVTYPGTPRGGSYMYPYPPT